MYLIDVIEEEGFKAYEAADADEAISSMEAHADIRVLFTDIDMPGSMDGVKLSHCVCRRWPLVRIFVASGRMSPRVEEMPLNSIFLRKPYGASELQQIFDAALATGRP